MLLLVFGFFVFLAGCFAVFEAALNVLPPKEIFLLRHKSFSRSVVNILDSPVEHVSSVRFFKTFSEIVITVCFTLFLFGLLDNFWLVLFFAVLVMLFVSFLFLGVFSSLLGSKWSFQIISFGAPFIRFLRILVGPIPGFLNFIVRFFSLEVVDGSSVVAQKELRVLMGKVGDSNVFEEDEVELIQSVFDLGETIVREVMVPRTDMVTVYKDMNLLETMSVFFSSGFSRIPVIGDSKDEVFGVAYFKDIAFQLQKRPDLGETSFVKDFVRVASYVPESKAVGQLLKQMQDDSVHVSIVVDEYGGTAGLVTLEDILEEIVGEIVDEYDSEQVGIEKVGVDKYLVNVRLALDDFASFFEIVVDYDDVDTVGGLFAKVLGKVPVVGSEVLVQGWLLVISASRDRFGRFKTIVVSRDVGESKVVGVLGK